ncbi:MAG: putative SOS response-associated peptidase YedK [Cyclobacteriaceae bacterium]|jgi:putative SOS response-associated peptidase YedK
MADLTDLAHRIDPAFGHNQSRYHSNAFQHPELPVILNTNEPAVSFASWGLVPFWTKDATASKQIQNLTLNARGEELFEKPSFKEPAQNRRCVILLDGFFEHHHRSNKTFPYHILHADARPMSVAGLWDQWLNIDTGIEVQTVTIVTTVGNKRMSEIHNNPKLTGPRMPVILDENTEQDWLSKDTFDVNRVASFLDPYSEDLLDAYTVRPLRGKASMGNQQKAIEQFAYMELQKGLFDM